MATNPSSKAKKEKQDSASNAIPLFQRLTFRLPLQVSILSLVIFIALGTTVSLSIYSLILKNTEETISYVAQKNATKVADYLAAMQTKAHDLSLTMSTINNVTLPDEDKSALIQDIMNRMLDDERVFSVYTAWEPNTIFANTENGQSYYFYRSNGNINVDIFQDYETYQEGDYYYVARDTKKPYITEPYAYTLTSGNVVWLITISNPVFDNAGKFLGVANTDIIMGVINELEYDNGGYDTSYGYILSNEGVFLTHSTNEELLGTSILDGKTGNGLAVAENIIKMTKGGEVKMSRALSLVNGKMSYIMQVPLQVEGIENYFSSTFVVAESEAFRAMNELIITVVAISLGGLVLLMLLAQFIIRKSLQPLSDVLVLADNIKHGNLNNALTIKTKDEFGHLAASFVETSKVLQNYIAEISSSLTTLASGDLRVEINQDYVGDFAPIKTALIQIATSLNKAMSRIGVSANLVNAGASQISSSSQALAAGATEQAATLEELNASIGTVAKEARDNAEHVKNAATLVSQTTSNVNKGSKQMDLLNRSMLNIGDSSRQIAGITKLVEDIAFQTNILALNAAVEAARAGSAGKGFAVVADEVRNLASKSSDAAKQTADLVKQSSVMIDEGIVATEQTVQILKDIVEQTMRVNEEIAEIEKASNVQANAILEITQGLSQVSDVVQTNAATSEESSASSAEMSNQAKVLWEEVNKFTLSDKN